MSVISFNQCADMNKARKKQQLLLINACEKGDLEEVKKIIQFNKDVGKKWNEWNYGGFRNGVYIKPSITWLIDVENQPDTSWTPIMFAARYGHKNIV